MAGLLLDSQGVCAAQSSDSGATPLHCCFWPAALPPAMTEAGAAICSRAHASAEGSISAEDNFACQSSSTASPDRLAVARLLLPHLAGGQIDLATAAERATPLMHAAAAGSAPAVALLLGAGASRDERDVHGRSALMVAAVGGCTDAITLLLQPGGEGEEASRPRALVDVQDEERNTALCLATAAHQLPAAELLLGAQARLDLVPPPLLAQLAIEAELKSAKAARSKAIAAGAAALADRDAAQRAAAEAEQARAALQKQLQAAQAAASVAGELQRKLAAAEGANAQLSGEVTCLRGELEAARQREGSLQQQLDAACDQLLQSDRQHQDELAGSAEAAERERSRAAAQAGRLQSEMRWLREAAEALQVEKLGLESRAAQLQQELEAQLAKGWWQRMFGGGGSKQPASGARPRPSGVKRRQQPASTQHWQCRTGVLQ
ncbi:hypothetical protein ABPG75_000547 [Micractinium tetrahymenae]